MKTRIKKTLATFGDQKAIIYGEFLHKNDMEANYHIEDLGEGNDGGRYMLTIENQGWMDDDRDPPHSPDHHNIITFLRPFLLGREINQLS